MSRLLKDRRHMRLPLHKPYRAFPELDRFSDAECMRFAAAARRHHRVGTALLCLLYLPALAIACPLLFAVPAGICYVLGIGDTRSDDGATVLVWTLSLVGVAGGFSLAALLARDRWLRRIIGKQLRGAACYGCGYSLLGLPVVDGAITCPECGRPFNLAEADLNAEDLLAPAAATAEGSRSRPAVPHAAAEGLMIP